MGGEATLNYRIRSPVPLEKSYLLRLSIIQQFGAFVSLFQIVAEGTVPQEEQA